LIRFQTRTTQGGIPKRTSPQTDQFPKTAIRKKRKKYIIRQKPKDASHRFEKKKKKFAGLPLVLRICDKQKLYLFFFSLLKIFKIKRIENKVCWHTHWAESQRQEALLYACVYFFLQTFLLYYFWKNFKNIYVEPFCWQSYKSP
jgi:hypothetical protein